MQDQRKARRERVPSSIESASDTYSIAHQANILTKNCQQFIQQRDGIVPYLCSEVERITRGRAQLLIYSPVDTLITDKSHVAIFPVQYGSISYGNLVCFSALPEQQKDSSLDVMEDVANACAIILYMLENTCLARRSQKTQVVQKDISLTKREIDVLTCIGRGQTLEEIAVSLTITCATVKKHRQHVYEKLEVTCESDAVLMGYCAGLFSPIENIVRR